MNYLTLQQLIFSSDPIIRNNANSIKKQLERNAKDCRHTVKIGDEYHEQCTACYREFTAGCELSGCGIDKPHDESLHN